jgi:cobalt-precorrin 5A hydrolase
MGGDSAMTRPIAVGVGCRLGCQPEAIEALVRQALESVPDAPPLGLFTIEDKRAEAGLAEAATRLGLDLNFLPREELRDRTSSVRTRSPRSESLFGVRSVAEAAALAGAGPGSVLLVARIARDGVTCAIAGSRETGP